MTTGDVMSTSLWRLADYYEPTGDDEEFPEYIIYSESELRQYLTNLAKKPPRIAELYSPHGDCLRIGIGGDFAGLAWIRNSEVKTLMASQAIAPTCVEFEIQGQPSTFRPDELHSPEVVMDVACYFFTHGTLPNSQRWE
jgi:hypothetical protein